MNSGDGERKRRWTVRKAAPRDHAWLVDGCCNLARETEGIALDRKTVEQGVRSALQNGHATYLVAYPVGNPAQIAGQLMITREWSDWRNGWFWWVQSVWIAPDSRRKGVYSALHDAVETRAAAQGDVCGIRLYVEPENHAAIATYQALGMQRAEYYLMESDFSGIRELDVTEAHLD